MNLCRFYFADIETLPEPILLIIRIQLYITD